MNQTNFQLKKEQWSQGVVTRQGQLGMPNQTYSLHSININFLNISVTKVFYFVLLFFSFIINVQCVHLKSKNFLNLKSLNRYGPT